MKIVYIATSIIPSRTANSIHVMKMCQAFAQNGHEVTLIVPDWKEGVEPGVEDVYEFYGVERCFEIEYIPLYSIKGKGLLFGFQAALASKRLGPDLVYGRDVGGCYFASLMHQETIFESHAPLEDYFYRRILNQLLKSNYLKKLVVITHSLKNYYVDQYPSIANSIIVAPDGADPISNTAAAIEFQNKGKKLQVGYVGHLYQGRGIDIIYQLAERCSWADFHIIGGTDNDITLLQANIKPLNNFILHGFKPPREAERYRIGCDVLIAPYQERVSVYGNGNMTTERWMSPMKIFEYMAAGKAIICSDISVLREIMNDGGNALLCHPDDIDAWENRLKNLLINVELRIQLGKNAKKDLISKYSWHTRANKLISYI